MTSSMTVKNKIDPDEAREALWQAIWVIQQKMPILKKTADNPFFHSKYADLPGIMEVLQPLLTENNLILLHRGAQHPTDPTMIGVETELLHSSGCRMASTFFAKPSKPGAQEVGSCITYLRRYGIQALLAITSEDDDGEAAEGRTVPATPAKATTTATPAPKFTKPTTTAAAQPPILTAPMSDDTKRGLLLKYSKEFVAAGLQSSVTECIKEWSSFQRKDKETKEPMFDSNGNPVMQFKTDVAELKDKWLNIAYEKGKKAYLELMEEQEVVPE